MEELKQGQRANVSGKEFECIVEQQLLDYLNDKCDYSYTLDKKLLNYSFFYNYDVINLLKQGEIYKQKILQKCKPFSEERKPPKSKRPDFTLTYYKKGQLDKVIFIECKQQNINGSKDEGIGVNTIYHIEYQLKESEQNCDFYFIYIVTGKELVSGQLDITELLMKQMYPNNSIIMKDQIDRQYLDMILD